MESIGAKLRNAREEKGYSLEQVARDTHIAKRYLEAMENEEFDSFPGEPYLLGFLRTYSEFLELSPQEMVSLYKNLKLQEQPAPMDELLVRRSPRPYIVAGIIAVLVIGLGIGAYVLISSESFQARRVASEQQRQEAQEAPQPAAYTLEDEILEQPFSQGDIIDIPLRDGDFPLTIQQVADQVTIATGSGTQAVRPNQEQLVDVNNDGRPDIKLLVREINAQADPPTVVLRLDRVVQSPGMSGTAALENAPPPGTPTDTPVIGSSSEPSRIKSSLLIGEYARREDFQVNITFRGQTMFRYKVDEGTREQHYEQNGDAFSTTVQDRFQIWLSNAGVVNFSVAGHELNLGDAGEVVAAVVTWTPDDATGGQRLELIPVY